MMKKQIIFFLLLVLIAGCRNEAPEASKVPVEKIYKYVIKGGHLIDPKNNIDEVMDIAISAPTNPDRGYDRGSRDGKIALVAKNINPDLGEQVIDARGLYVSPGLIDMHVHVFWGSDMEGTYRNGPMSVPPDGFALRTGVTTVVDAGCAGWRNFEAFKEQTIDFSNTRVLAFLNIVGEGMAGGKYENDLNDMDARKTADMILKYPEHIVGIKNAHYYGPGDTYLIPIRRGIEAGELAGGKPLMLDGRLGEEIFDLFRPGDIFTHVYGRAIVDSADNIKPFVLKAREKGIIFDVGFGGASFRLPIAEPALNAGFFPDAISTDLHINSMNSAMKDMPNIMSIFLAKGMKLAEVIEASTWNPAKYIQREDLGHLSVGAVADVTIFDIRKGDFGFLVIGGEIRGTQRIENEITIRGGEIVYNLNGRISPVTLPPAPGQRGRI